MRRIVESILYVVKQLEGTGIEVGKARIMKILYLADLLAKSKIGKTITGAEYRYYLFGPYSHEVEKAITSLKEEGYLSDNTELTKFGLAHDYKFIGESHEVQFTHLAKEEIEILNSVIERFGRIELLQLLDIVYTTEPMKKALPGEILKL